MSSASNASLAGPGPASSVALAPRQQRSRETLARILDAVAETLEEVSFEEMTVAQVCARAGCSVGTFYGRVVSKEGVLDHLQARLFADLEATIAALLDRERWAACDLPRMLADHAALVVELHTRQRGVVRAMIVEARRRRDFGERTAAFNRALLDRVVGLWASRAEDIQHPDPAVAARQAALMAVGYLREAVLFDELWPGGATQDRAARDREVSDALAHMLTSFLTGQPPPPKSDTREGTK